MDHPTAEWTKLYNRYYRKRELYEMSWEKMDLGKNVCCGAPFGGPLVVTRDDMKILLVNKQNSIKPTVQLFTSAGALISSFLWDKTRVVGIGWTDDDHLVLVVEDGTVCMYDIHGTLTNQFSLGTEVKEQRVWECRVWGTGLVVITRNYEIYALTDFVEPRPKKLADSGLTEPPTSWEIIEPRFTMSTNVEVLLATKSGTLLVIDAVSCQDMLLAKGPYTKLAVSPNGTILAMFSQMGVLEVVHTDFSKRLSEFGTKSTVPPQQMVWCGTDSVVLYWDKIVLLVGPWGDWIKYSYDEPISLVPEVDGVRIISNTKCEFLQRVPDVTEDIFSIGSTKPAAMLYDAMEHYEKRSPKADENIRSIKEELVEAVDACVEAAGQEYSPSMQQQLLKAGSFGKCFLDRYFPHSFVEMCRTLRVLNAVRNYKVGIPISYQQYQTLTPERLIGRLIDLNHHLLAWRICQYLGIRGDRVLIHWACCKVRTAPDDVDICDLIVSKLGVVPGISYAEIASTAYKNGRPALATKLLDFEPRAADQVPLLISMEEVEHALLKAIESGDTDLVYLVLLHIKRTHTQADFFKVIRHKRVAIDLLIAYCKQQDVALLKEIYFHSDQPMESANLRVWESFKKPQLSERIRELERALKLYKASTDTAAANFASATTQDQIRLLLVQADLESDLQVQFLDLSLNDTLFKLVQLGDERRATKLRTDFKVPDKRWWWLMIRALAHKRDWDSLFKFAKSKRSPIGYAPFAEVCIGAKASQEAATYIPKCEVPATKVELFIRIDHWKDAGDIAAKEAKDPEMLQSIRQRCQDAEANSYLDGLLKQFQARR
eukprot:TRINITY_DN397_c0_g1_i3.p1 TRINITY_DN397_c0_g1~~TRINITY_DN397_c0_g1_i3.p1  ORF type:complete len:827 (-),score=204.45 TRINITY_DN397_c0_g1_i3:93-2573(-)